MEEQLFTSTGFDIQDTQVFTFYSVELLVQVGDYPVGTKFWSADVNYDEGTVSFTNEGERKNELVIVAKFKLKLVVGEEV